jgi:hypothetical protein
MQEQHFSRWRQPVLYGMFYWPEVSSNKKRLVETQTKDAGNFFQFEIEKALSWETESPLSMLELDHYSLKWTSTHQCTIKDGW